MLVGCGSELALVGRSSQSPSPDSHLCGEKSHPRTEKIGLPSLRSSFSEHVSHAFCFSIRSAVSSGYSKVF